MKLIIWHGMCYAFYKAKNLYSIILEKTIICLTRGYCMNRYNLGLPGMLTSSTMSYQAKWLCSQNILK